VSAVITKEQVIDSCRRQMGRVLATAKRERSRFVPGKPRSWELCTFVLGDCWTQILGISIALRSLLWDSGHLLADEAGLEALCDSAHLEVNAWREGVLEVDMAALRGDTAAVEAFTARGVHYLDSSWEQAAPGGEPARPAGSTAGHGANVAALQGGEAAAVIGQSESEPLGEAYAGAAPGDTRTLPASSQGAAL